VVSLQLPILAGCSEHRFCLGRAFRNSLIRCGFRCADERSMGVWEVSFPYTCHTPNKISVVNTFLSNYRNFIMFSASAREVSALSQEFQTRHTKFRVLMLMNTRITVFWVVTPCSFVDRYKLFGGIYCRGRLYRKQSLKTDTAGFSEVPVLIYQTKWRYTPKDSSLKKYEFVRCDGIDRR
jgi:hypothetical protein